MFRDSLGNVYKSLPHRPPQHTAKATRSGAAGRAGRKARKNSGEWQRKAEAAGSGTSRRRSQVPYLPMLI